ncbi:PREDICTED: cyclin-L2-like [Dipodomys ordii]|uniref:Cyclin-L2-like n=1 Tax=Dipodomys ordii TaxID=10020 RepID=A0A1S3GDR0_DIPOR|nr:PREDICTED: cyclin-L2-like [Dipodomys ordii]
MAAAATGAPGSAVPAAAAGASGSGVAAPGSQGVLIGDKLYSGVLITLENCLLPDDKLRFTPSMSSGLDTDTETGLRVVGCELIQAAGILKPVPLLLDQEYVNLKNQIIKAERRVLKELGFCVHVKHPHKVGYILVCIYPSHTPVVAFSPCCVCES